MVQRRPATTVNRRLAALRKVFVRAKGAGYSTDQPTLSIKGVSTGPRTAKSLDTREISRLLR